MAQELPLLVMVSASIGFLHVLVGPDHYLPFIAMAKARQWSLARTAWITALCGVGHIGSSVVLSLLGIALGMAAAKVEALESLRGSLAAWGLISFGLLYFAWGMRKAYRRQPHRGEEKEEPMASLVPWILFTIFVFGPCEPLIPLLLYPGVKESVFRMALVTGIFGGTTVLTMVGIVIPSTLGLAFLPVARLERYRDALAGAVVCMCGLAVQFLGL
jgi:nickel/cobalt exporter